MVPEIGIALTSVGLVGALTAENNGATTFLRVMKPAASVGFLLAAIGFGAFDSSYGLTIFVGLVLCLLGDVFLMWREDAPFRLGIVSFLLGHVAYVAAFGGRGSNLAWAGLILVACLIVAVVVLRWLLPNVRDDMKRPVLAYVTVISLMVVSAFGTHGLSPAWPIVVGAVGFYVSDLFVARDRFVEQSFVNRLVGLPLYYAAQIVLAYSISVA